MPTDAGKSYNERYNKKLHKSGGTVEKNYEKRKKYGKKRKITTPGGT